MKKKLWIAIGIVSVALLISIVVWIVCIFKVGQEKSVESTTLEVYELKKSTSSSEESTLSSEDLETSVPYAVPAEITFDEYSYTLKNEDENFVVREDIEAVFERDVRDYVSSVFGEFVRPLQGLYHLLGEVGYVYPAPFYSDDITRAESVDSCEFTLYLPGTRGRVRIWKDANGYTTTFRHLDYSEFTVPVEPDGLDAVQESTEYYNPSEAGYFHQADTEPPVGYETLNLSYYDNIEEVGLIDDSYIEMWWEPEFLNAIKSMYGGYEPLQAISNFMSSEAPYLGIKWKVIDMILDNTYYELWIDADKGGVPRSYYLQYWIDSDTLGAFVKRR